MKRAESFRRVAITVKVHPKDYELMKDMRADELGDLLSDGFHALRWKKEYKPKWWRRLGT